MLGRQSATARLEDAVRVARVIVDIPARELDRPFDYLIPERWTDVEVGSCVLVDFANRPAVGYVVGLGTDSDVARAQAALAPFSADRSSESSASEMSRVDRRRSTPVRCPRRCGSSPRPAARRRRCGMTGRTGPSGRSGGRASDRSTTGGPSSPRTGARHVPRRTRDSAARGSRRAAGRPGPGRRTHRGPGCVEWCAQGA